MVALLIIFPDNSFANKWFADEAKRFISNNKGRPFFLYVSFTLSHVELVVPQTLLNLYLNKDGTSFFSLEVLQKRGLHYGAQQYPKVAYAAIISQMVSYVGELVTHLKKNRIR